MATVPTTETTVARLVAAINSHDAAGIVELCTADHEFVDAAGAVTGSGRLLAAWTDYFGFMPEYGIEIDAMLCVGDTAAVFGHAWGSLAKGVDGWRRPAAWRAVVADGKVRRWQVYVDTKPVFDLLAAAG